MGSGSNLAQARYDFSQHNLIEMKALYHRSNQCIGIYIAHINILKAGIVGELSESQQLIYDSAMNQLVLNSNNFVKFSMQIQDFLALTKQGTKEQLTGEFSSTINEISGPLTAGAIELFVKQDMNAIIEYRNKVLASEQSCMNMILQYAEMPDIIA